MWKSFCVRPTAKPSSASITERMAQARAIDDPVERLVATIDSGVASGPDDPETRLLWEGTRLAGESELFSVLMTTLHKQQELLYVNILELGAAVGAFKLNDEVPGSRRRWSRWRTSAGSA